jgi:biopolymer transport protein ExbB/TolQ
MDEISLSAPHLFLQAGTVGKSVMIVLLAASIWCWILIVEGIYIAVRLARALNETRGDNASPLLTPIIDAGTHAASITVGDETPSERRQRIADVMNRAGTNLLVDAGGGLANLAVISSVAPFVGLFGTVWGIMTSFAAIAAAKDTGLAVVAPGIAEALSATAYGLAAAIPASIAYNRIGAQFSRLGHKLYDLIAERAVALTLDRTDAGAKR